MQDVARLLVLGAELTQMPAWYVDLSYGQALESYALMPHPPPHSMLHLLQQGILLPPCLHKQCHALESENAADKLVLSSRGPDCDSVKRVRVVPCALLQAHGLLS